MRLPRDDARTLPTVAVHTLIFVLSIVFSVTGNSLVCLAFYRNRRLRTVSNFYVVSLALADILMATFEYPFNAIASGLQKWPFGFNFCQFNGFISFFWAVVSMNVLALTALNRYICVVKPRFYSALFTKKKTVSSIIFVWIFTLSVGITSTLAARVSFEWQPGYLFCQISSNEIPGEEAFVSTLSTVFFVLPMCIILFCYGSVYHTIRRHNSAIIPSLQEGNSQGSLSAHEIQASRILLAAVTSLCICWIPAAVMNFVRAANLNIPSFWQSFYTFSAACSSWINPIIYGVMSRAMRNEFIKLLRCRKEN